VPESVRAWCREHRRHLLAGGKEPAANGNYTNTAFVIGPDGEVVFKTGESRAGAVHEGRIAGPRTAGVASPWGKIGIGICYDLSYARVTDRADPAGAPRPLIVPTGDLSEWAGSSTSCTAASGRCARRSTAYRSSGFPRPASRKWWTARGRFRPARRFPGELATIAGVLELQQPGTLPLDRWVAPLSVFVTALVICGLILVLFRKAGAPAR